MKYGRASEEPDLDELDGLTEPQTEHARKPPGVLSSNKSCHGFEGFCTAFWLLVAILVAFFCGMVYDFLMVTSHYPGDFTSRGASELEVELWRSFRPCAVCKEPARFGGANDGGYIMCKELLRPEHAKAVISYGINGEDAWGAMVSDHLGSVTVHQYDCTSTPPPCLPGLRCNFAFHRECLVNGQQAGEKDRPVGTLADHVMSLGYKPLYLPWRGDPGPGLVTAELVMKLDIEGSEWPILANASNKAFLARFSQLMLEVHGLQEATRVRAEAMRNLLDLFNVVHVHANNAAGPPIRRRGFYLSGILEVSMVRRGLAQAKPCEDEPAYSGLDAANEPSLPEFPQIRLGGS